MGSLKQCACVCEEQQNITSFWEREKKNTPKTGHQKQTTGNV